MANQGGSVFSRARTGSKPKAAVDGDGIEIEVLDLDINLQQHI